MKNDLKIKKLLEKHDFTFLSGTEFETFTPLGEDWILCFETLKKEDVIKEIEFLLDGGIDEETTIYIDNRGKHGIPENIFDLVKDGEWKKEILQEIKKEIEENIKRGV